MEADLECWVNASLQSQKLKYENSLHIQYMLQLTPMHMPDLLWMRGMYVSLFSLGQLNIDII